MGIEWRLPSPQDIGEACIDAGDEAPPPPLLSGDGGEPAPQAAVEDVDVGNCTASTTSTLVCPPLPAWMTRSSHWL